MTDQLQDLVLQLRTAGFKAGGKDVDLLYAKLSRLNKAVAGSATGATKSVKIYDQYGNAIKKVSQRTEKAATATKKLAATTKETQKGFLGLGDTLDHTIKKVAMWTLSTGAVYGTMRAFRQGIEVITEHDAQMIGLRKVYSGVESDLAGIEAAVMRTAREMKSLHESAFEAAIVVARTGRVGVDVTRLTEAALIAQNIAELQAADAVKFLNAAMIQFNQTTDQTIRVLDEWNELSNVTPATTMDLAQAVSVAGSVFEQAGSNIQYLNAMTAALVEITAKSGNIIGRAERTMAIFARRQSTVNLLARIGIRVFEGTEKQFIGIDRLLTQLAAKWGTMNDQWKAAIAQSMAGARQQQFFIALMENQDLVLGNLITQWDSFGSAIKENEMFLQSIRKNIDGLINALERLAIGIGDAGLKGIINGMIITLTNMVNAFNDATFAMSATAAIVGVLAARFALLQASMGVIGAISLALGAFIATLTTLNAVFDTSTRLMREQEELAQRRIRSLGMEQNRLESVVGTLGDLSAARKDVIKDEEASAIVNERIKKVLDALKNIYPTLSSEMGTLGGAYDVLTSKLYKTNKQLAEQQKLLLELQRVQLEERLEPLLAPLGPRYGETQAEVVKRWQSLMKTFPSKELPTGITAERLKEAQSLLFQIDAIQAQIADIALAALGAPSAPGEAPSAELNKQLESLKLQQQIYQWMLQGKREEWIIQTQINMLRDKLLNVAMGDVDIERTKLQILQLQVRQQQLMIQKARQWQSAFSAGIAGMIAGGFEDEAVDRAMNTMVRRLGNILAEQAAESIQRAMLAAGVQSSFLMGLATGGVAGIISGIFGLAANRLFGDQTEAERQTDAVEENTIQLRVLSENIRDLTSYFVNVPAGFAIPPGAPGFTGGGAANVAGGASAASIQQIDQRSITIAPGAIQVTQQPGENGGEFASRVETQLLKGWGQGAQVEQSY